MSKYLQVFLIFINIKESKDVRMFNEFHDCNFPLHLGEDRLGQLLLVDDLDGNLLALHHVGANFDKSCKTTTKTRVIVDI